MLYLLIFVIATSAVLLYIKKMANGSSSGSAYDQRDPNEVSKESVRREIAEFSAQFRKEHQQYRQQTHNKSVSSVGSFSSMYSSNSRSSDPYAEQERLEERERLEEEMNDELEREGERSMDLLDDSHSHDIDSNYDY